MFNLHAHTFLSDGQLVHSEIAVRYRDKGYKIIAITDHADYSNIKQVIGCAVEFCRKWPKNDGIKVLPGVELTHVPPQQFKPLAALARKEGARIIIAHGQTLMEPVAEDTNHQALLADIDILAHPGLISDSDTQLAAKRGIFLEITSRNGHKQTNAHVAKQARKFGARLIINHDSHGPQDIITPLESIRVAQDAGLNKIEIEKIYCDVGEFLNKKPALNSRG